MAKLSLKIRQKKREALVLKYKKKRQELKNSKEFQKLDKLPKNSVSCRLHNRCSITGRSRGYMRKFGISRIIFREWASQGKIPGIKKASW